MRVAPPHLPVPFSLPLEKAFIPDEAQIADAVRRTLAKARHAA
jgi:pyruvate/2-oxoglutarate/acetoin dehydrogenase E1 component